ncbi:PIR protein [Plasmodium vivax]|uniref:VIR protein n=1 Tax=Plasmodium vivax TaxID=5855 RepID=A0A565A4V2_PLAVI|nr:PIR protein [Plasmodium vivax]
MDGQDSITRIIKNAFSLSDVLNSEIFYKRLYGLDILKEFDAYCAPLLALDRGRILKNICAQMLSYLKTKYSNPNNQNDQYDVCTLLNYWVYNRIDMAYGYKNDFKVIHAFGKLQPIWYDYIDKKLGNANRNICEPIPDIPAQRDWKQRRELIDYCSDVNDLRKITVSHPNTCNNYYEYIKSKTELYKQYEKLCDSGNKDRCPDFFDKCREYDPEKVLHSLNCHTQMQKLMYSTAKAINEDGENPKSPVSEADSDDFSQLQRKNTPTVTKAGNVLLGVVITSMTSGALYKFTPLGVMIRNGLGWNNNNMSNINGGDIRLYDYASESFNPYPGEEHYIGYHPA